MPGSSLAHPVHNEKDLEPYHEPPLHRHEGRPVAEIIKGQEEWEVEEILAEAWAWVAVFDQVEGISEQ